MGETCVLLSKKYRLFRRQKSSIVAWFCQIEIFFSLVYRQAFDVLLKAFVRSQQSF
jgi:hypothetical protein